MESLICFFYLVGLVILLLCAIQLLDLMRRNDDEFPGRYDKALWVAIIIFIPFFGVFLYLIGKPRAQDVSSPAFQREWEAMQKNRAVTALQSPENRPDITPEPPKA